MHEEDCEQVQHHVHKLECLLEVLALPSEEHDQDRNECNDVASNDEKVRLLVVTVTAFKCLSSVSAEENDQKDDMEHWVLEGDLKTSQLI